MLGADQLIANTPQTFIYLRALDNNQTYYFSVTAVDSNGIESDFSNTEELFVNISSSDTNQILNGDFSQGPLYWELGTNGSASADGRVENEYYIIQIDSSSMRSSDIQLRQNNLTLIENRYYRLEFDARSTEPKIFDVRLQKSFSPFTDYSRIGAVYSTEEWDHYRFEFNMDFASDYAAQIVFDCGQSTADLSIDNVSLTQEQTQTNLYDARVTEKNFVLYQNYPNPFNPLTMINYQLPITNHVELSICNVLGQKLVILVNKKQKAGYHQVEWNASRFASGIYYSVLEAGDFIDIKKMVFIK